MEQLKSLFQGKRGKWMLAAVGVVVIIALVVLSRRGRSNEFQLSTYPSAGAGAGPGSGGGGSGGGGSLYDGLIKDMTEQVTQLQKDQQESTSQFTKAIQNTQTAFTQTVSNMQSQFDKQYTDLQKSQEQQMAGISAAYGQQLAGLQSSFGQQFAGLMNQYSSLESQYSTLKGQYATLEGQQRLMGQSMLAYSQRESQQYAGMIPDSFGGIGGNVDRIANDRAYRDSEVARTLDQIGARDRLGMDSTAQMDYLRGALGYTGIVAPEPIPQQREWRLSEGVKNAQRNDNSN